ncbi:hypothetical protein EMPS_03839 [Entomortierella parvispora]|uniref:Uncharacterized protein n=1 Tax=Entomortierella parvispora TaxID=205924 RepID=A0A9P3H7C1_9FUNG|nr:hypothetical protein EMPS_03839 [Entomortierella parvispora]
MRLLAPRLTAYVAIAGILCLSSTLAIDVATENDIAMPNADVNAAIPDDDFSDLNHGKKHHKHHGSKEKETKLCNATLEALNNGGGNITKVYIFMDKPCSKELPPLCAAALEAAAEEATEAAKDADEADKSEEPQAPDAPAEVDPQGLADEDAEAEADVDLWKKHHHKHGKHYRHRHGNQPHKGHHHHGKHHKDHKHDRHGHSKKKHPWEDLCVAVGAFCGDNLYGCDFDFKTLYACTAVGEKPTILLANAVNCGGTDDGGKCNCKSTAPVCGSSLDPSCKADPNAIYHCTNGNGTKYEIFQMCSPGTQCTTDKDGTASCGSDTCHCMGTQQRCSSHFPDKCGLQKNSIYQCSSTGQPEFVSSCGDDKICITHEDGAICRSKDCECTVDGTVCGERFPPACNIVCTGLYDCKTGQAPVLIKNCYPNHCTSSVGSTEASAVFEAADVMDSCSDPCKCTSKGKFCGSTFPISCGFDTTALYSCDGSDSTPIKGEVCSDTFPAVCHYKKGTLMSCTALNAIPTIAQNCTDGCLVEPGNDMCKPIQCVCQKAGDSCSSSFPANCGYDHNTLYKCSGAGALPVKKATCTSTEICTVVGGGNDFCGESTCSCVGSGAVCGSAFPPNCNKTATSVYTCPAGTETPCPAGCADGMCPLLGCMCSGEGNFCGSTFSPFCNLLPNALYGCTTGAPPVLQFDCGVDSCAGSQCQDPCLCKGANNACGSTFPPICGFSATTLYSCFAVNNPPYIFTDLPNCTAGCELSSPDNQCVNPCTQEAANALTDLQAVITSLTSTIAATTEDNVSVVDLPVLLQFFTTLESNLTSTAPGIGTLTQLAGSALNSVNSVFLLLAGALNETLFQNATINLLAPVNSTLQTGLLSALQALVTCTGSTTKDCTALNQLFNAFTDAALTYVSQFTTPVADQRASNTTAGTATFSAQLTTAAADITASIATVNQTALDASGLLLNLIIGLASNTQYGSASQVMIFVYDAAGYAAACAGLNVTNWQDACNSFGQRTQGFLAGLIGVIQNFLGQIPIVGPYIVDPVLTQLRNLLADAQTGVADAIGGILSAVQMILSILNIVGSNDSTEQIQNFILGTVDIATPPSQCPQPSGCGGVIMAFNMLLTAVYALLDANPMTTIVVGLVQPLANEFLSALNSATGSVIISAATMFISDMVELNDDLVMNFPSIDGALSTVTSALDVLANGAQAIINCYINNPAL